MIGGSGSDVMSGGAWVDVADYSTSGAGVTVNLGTGVNSGGDAAGDSLTGVENLTGSAYADSLTGDGGANTILGGAGADTVSGGGGNDALFGGDGTANLFGGDGNDALYGGAGSDLLTGGAGEDTIFGGAGDVVDGGSTGTDNDILDLTGQGPHHIFRDTLNPENGYIEFYDSFGAVIGTLVFTDIETIVSCFTSGTRIATPEGARAIESLKPGDLVLTRDSGPKPLSWIGSRRIGRAELLAEPALRPVLIRRGALGAGSPSADMMVSRQHRMLFSGPRAELLFGADEVLVRAAHLVGLPGITVADTAEVTYLHLLFDRHELVLADGAWSESFQPGDRTLQGLDADQRDELFRIFPELVTTAELPRFDAARTTLKAFEARVLLAA